MRPSVLRIALGVMAVFLLLAMVPAMGIVLHRSHGVGFAIYLMPLAILLLLTFMLAMVAKAIVASLMPRSHLRNNPGAVIIPVPALPDARPLAA